MHFEHHGGEPYMTPIDSRGYKAASKAIQTTFGKVPVPVRGGGSIPICSILEKELGIKIVFMGFGLDSDNLHSPNEKYNLENFYKGIETIPYFHKFLRKEYRLKRFISLNALQGLNILFVKHLAFTIPLVGHKKAAPSLPYILIL